MTDSTIFQGPDGWYFTDPEGEEDFGPYPTAAAAEHGWQTYKSFFIGTCKTCGE